MLPRIIHREASGDEVNTSVGICFARGSDEIAKIVNHQMKMLHS